MCPKYLPTKIKMISVKCYKKIDEIKTDGGTAFYDALNDAITRTLQKNTTDNSTKWIVSLTDGEDNNSKYTTKSIATLISNCPVNIVIITVGELKNRNGIANICKNAKKKSNGIFIQISKNPDEISKVFAKVVIIHF